MGEFPVLATHQSMAVVLIGPLSLLILIHAIISGEDFWQIKSVDNNFRPFLTSELQFKTKVVLSNQQFWSQLSQVSKIVCIKLLKRKGVILKNITANFKSCTFTMSHANNCGINPTQVINNKN